MVSRAQSQSHFETDRLPFSFSPLPYVAENLASNDLQDDDSKIFTTIELVGGIVSIPILLLTILSCLLNQQFRLHAPTLHPGSFSLSRFNVSDSNLVTFFIDIDLTFGCKHCGYETLFRKINGTILYKDERVLSMVSVEPFGLGKKELKTLHIKFATSRKDGEKLLIKQQILNKMEKDLKNGMVHLNLKVDNLVSFKKWGVSWDVAGPGVKSYCWDLAVTFSATTGVGTLIGGGRDECWEPGFSQ